MIPVLRSDLRALPAIRIPYSSRVFFRPKMCLYDGLLPRALSIFELPSLRSGQRGIVIGMGGGCDVLGALAFAQAWEARSPGATVLFANCVSPRPMPSHEQLAPHLWRCPPNVVPLAAGDGCYGSTRLEQSLPRGAEGVASGSPGRLASCHRTPCRPAGSPFLLVVPEDGKGPSSVEEVTRANTGAITSSLARLCAPLEPPSSPPQPASPAARRGTHP